MENYFNDFYDPDLNFKYLSDFILWDQIFKKPFPVDLKNLSKGSVTLSNYFEVETFFIKLPNEKYERPTSQILPKEEFHQVEDKKRDVAFLTLCEFLVRFGRPYIACYINMPRNENVEINQEYHPASIFHQTPRYPIIKNGMLCIRFLEENRVSYEEFCYYMFGEAKNDARYNCECLNIGYGSRFFCGFLLHY